MTEPLDALAADALALAKSRRTTPGATYRLQMHAGFPIQAAREQTDYLHDLGVTHVYTSSLLAARPGSLHGYDVTDHGLLNPELGTEPEFRDWIAELRARGMGLVLDVVPNHMCVGGENAWWGDVLENGPSSPYAGYFDIVWNDDSLERLREKVLVPVLGEPYGKSLESGLIRLEFAAGSFALKVYERRFPVDPRTYGLILAAAHDAARAELGTEHEGVTELLSIVTAAGHLPPRNETDAGRVRVGRVEVGVIKRRLAELTARSPELAAHLDAAVARMNGTPGEPDSFGPLDGLLDAQAYRLCFWRVASDEINYRRFFDVNDLAALSTEREEVFEAVHRKVFDWLGAGLIDGIRIDHPDGLFDPKQYLRRLQVRYLVACAEHLSKTRPEAYPEVVWAEAVAPLRERFEAHAADGLLYVVVEKILAFGEQLPADWPCDGTTGYEFLNYVNGLFVDPAREKDADWEYQQFTGHPESFPELVYHSKFLVLQSTLAGELHILGHQLYGLGQTQRWSRDFTQNLLRHALREVIACFPVYRTYINGGVNDTDRRVVIRAAHQARLRNPTLGRAVFDFIRDTLLLKDPPAGPASDEYRLAQRRFAGKFQQVTAPVMAKGYEDTALYVFNRLVSLNEVGGDPNRFGLLAGKVHAFFRDRAERHPGAQSPLSTHDTKRSEDVRARVNVLGEMPEAWAVRASRWHDLNGDLKVRLDEESIAPDENEEYLFYQTLAGIWPASPPDAEAVGTITRRVQAYMNKALHEAKVHTSWINPDSDYDEAMSRFAASVLDPAKAGPFLARPRRVHRDGPPAGGVQLGRAVARPLHRPRRAGHVPGDGSSRPEPGRSRQPPAGRLRRAPRTARRPGPARAGRTGGRWPAPLALKPGDAAKLYAVSQALRFRREHGELFRDGKYEAVETGGGRAGHAFAFLRTHGDAVALVVVPRLLGTLCPGARTPVGPHVWGDTHVVLPERLGRRTWRDVLTGSTHAGDSTGSLALADVFGEFPAALLVME